MNKFNEFFAKIAERIPFAKDFFKSNLSIFGIEISNLFLALISLLFLLIAFVLIIIFIALNKKEKKAAATQKCVTKIEASTDSTKDTAADVVKESTIDDSETHIVEKAAIEQAEPQISDKKQQVDAIELDASKSENALIKSIAATVTTTEPSNKESAMFEKKAIATKKVEKAELTQTGSKNETIQPESQSETTQLDSSKDTAQADTKKDMDKRYSGKYEISVTACGYIFYLTASNGQVLYESNGYTSADGAIKGIDTFKNAVNTGTFIIDEDKFIRFRFVLNKRYVGENYTTKASCENSIGSVKKFSQSAAVMPYIADEEKEKAFKESLKAQKNQNEPDWEEIEKAEALIKPSGKFEITKGANGFTFALLANNGQLLYSSNGYASNKSALEGIKNFKKTVYSGAFFIDEDKFGRFRYILRGATFRSTYTGESYTTRNACEKIVQSVKRFVKSAVIPE